MKVNFYTYNYNTPNKVSFSSNARTYITKKEEYIGTMTFLFRDDLDWAKLANCAIQNFKNKPKVNVVQFASSDGSEAYSFIISMLEESPQFAKKFLPLQAYDIDPEVVRAAKSGYINLTKTDIDNLEIYTNGNNKYFTKTGTKLIIDNDYIFESGPNNTGDFAYKTYKVSEELTKNVQFNNKDMYKVLDELEDNFDTILMCRNILGYFDITRARYFIDIVAQKLKPGSLFVIGGFDCDAHKTLDQYIESKNFVEILPYIYQKIPN